MGSNDVDFGCEVQRQEDSYIWFWAISNALSLMFKERNWGNIWSPEFYCFTFQNGYFIGKGNIIYSLSVKINPKLLCLRHREISISRSQFLKFHNPNPDEFVRSMVLWSNCFDSALGTKSTHRLKRCLLG